MGKVEKTLYYCDRCGKLIFDDSKIMCGNFRSMRVLKWYIPLPMLGDYRLMYVCSDCYRSFEEWVKEGKDEQKE